MLYIQPFTLPLSPRRNPGLDGRATGLGKGGERVSMALPLAVRCRCEQFHVDKLGGDFFMEPGHEGVDLAAGPAVGEAREGEGEPGMRVDAVQLAGLDD